MKPNYGSSIFYRLKQISLVPDKYGKHLKIKMVSAYTGDGKFIKHIKLDEDMLYLYCQVRLYSFLYMSHLAIYIIV